MYTAVLMMALSGTSGDINFGRGACNGGNGGVCNGGGVVASSCNGSGGLFRRCGGGGLFGGGLFGRHRRSSTSCCAPVTCSTPATNGTNGGGTEMEPKMSKEVQDFIEGDPAQKEYYQGLKTNAEKQEFIDAVQKELDDEAAKAEKEKNKGKGKTKKNGGETSIPATSLNRLSFEQNLRVFILENRFAVLNTTRYLE